MGRCNRTIPANLKAALGVSRQAQLGVRVWEVTALLGHSYRHWLAGVGVHPVPETFVFRGSNVALAFQPLDLRVARS